MTLHSTGQVFAELHIDIFLPKNVKTVYKYYKSLDTIKHFENDHNLQERKTEYYPNGVISSDLQYNFFSTPPQDTCPYKVFTLNIDSTIHSERSYFTSDSRWTNEAIYKYKDKFSYEIIYGKKDKVVRIFNQKGSIIREESIWAKKYSTVYTFVYDSLNRLVQYACYPVKEPKWDKQVIFVFNYAYNQKHDSLFCSSREYILEVKTDDWIKLRDGIPTLLSFQNQSYKVELRPSFKVTVFNKKFEIIDERHCFQTENDPVPHVTWTRRTYVYEYY